MTIIGKKSVFIFYFKNIFFILKTQILTQEVTNGQHQF
jgi:hypothetical protein